MTQDPGEPLKPHRVIAARMKELRKARGWSAAHLAKEMTSVGVPWDRSIVANLELGRRATVSVDELFALAYVLNVAPVHFVVPTDDDGPDYQVAPGAHPVTLAEARAWIRGQRPLGDRRLYYGEMPRNEFYPEALARLRGRPDLQEMYVRAAEEGQPASALHMPVRRNPGGDGER